jgi:hypothetical protein
LFNLNFNHNFNQTSIFSNQSQLKVIFIKQLFSNHNRSSYRNTKCTLDPFLNVTCCWHCEDNNPTQIQYSHNISFRSNGSHLSPKLQSSSFTPLPNLKTVIIYFFKFCFFLPLSLFPSSLDQVKKKISQRKKKLKQIFIFTDWFFLKKSIMSTGDLLNIHPIELKFPCKFLSSFSFSCLVSEKIRKTKENIWISWFCFEVT